MVSASKPGCTPGAGHVHNRPNAIDGKDLKRPYHRQRQLDHPWYLGIPTDALAHRSGVKEQVLTRAP